MKDKQKNMKNGFVVVLVIFIACNSKQFLGLLGPPFIMLLKHVACGIRCLDKLSLFELAPRYNLTIFQCDMVPNLENSSKNTACFKVQNNTSYLT